jgi:osmotically-inducible protein OsmY
MKKTMLHAALITIVTSLFLINGCLSTSKTDDSIESSAKQSYVFKTYLKGDDIGIQSVNGVVALTGTVSKESHKLLAQETVASLPGVKSVNNKLELKEPPAMYSDAWLITKVQSTLWFHRNVNATGTEVLAEDGIITLRGTVSSQAQKDLTTEYARDVDGVKSVNNEMIVAGEPATPDEKTMSEKMDATIESIDDVSITALVKTTLLYHRSTSGLSTTVETNGGVVTLKGTAKNAAEKDLATKFASDVHGVKSVVNNMTVE